MGSWFSLDQDADLHTVQGVSLRILLASRKPDISGSNPDEPTIYNSIIGIGIVCSFHLYAEEEAQVMIKGYGRYTANSPIGSSSL